jgi:hypothetical protein
MQDTCRPGTHAGPPVSHFSTLLAVVCADPETHVKQYLDKIYMKPIAENWGDTYIQREQPRLRKSHQPCSRYPVG